MHTVAATPPEFWSKAPGLGGGTVLTYAVRRGPKVLALIALGAAAVLYCGSVIFRWVTEGDLTVAGWLFLLIVPGGGLVFGLRCLDVALRARTDYTLGLHGLAARQQSLFGSKAVEIPRQAVASVFQQYTPPDSSAPSSSPGTWATIVSYREGKSATSKNMALDGLGTPEEARWLGPLLADWASVTLGRGFDASNDEADPAELPTL